jgi:hypothetical protein
MDPTILQLFAADEILERLARKRLTGCFKVFTPLESANVYFKKGIVVAAVKGEAQGEAALRQILEWKEALFVWQPDLAAPAPPLKTVSIKMEDFLGRPSVSKNTALVKTVPPEAEAATASPLVSPVPSGAVAARTTATKSMTATAATRSAHDDELLKKYRLALVSVQNPAKKFRIKQVTSLIGRNPGSDITISDPSISRQHCLLQLADRGVHVKDLNTVNGTRINGITMKEGYINVGDKLTVGHLAFVLEQAKD